MNNFSSRFRILYVIFLFVGSGTIAHAQTAEAPAAGDGSPGSPYEISSIENLHWMSINTEELDNHFIQTQDINASVTSNWDSENGFNPIGTFDGVYDGNGYNISNLFIDRSSSDENGLFSTVGSTAEIKNLCVLDADITGNDFTGIIAGTNNGEISDSCSSGKVSGRSRTGGLVGSNTGTITSSHTDVEVTATWSRSGGLVGWDNNGTISRSFSLGSVSSSHNTIGGLIGKNESGSVLTDSYSQADITVTTTNNGTTGGLIGRNDGGIIENTYASGSVSSPNNFGGLIGENSGTVTNSYRNTDIVSDGNSIGTGLTSTEMRQQMSFEDWDFDTIWNINEGESFPYLHVEPQSVFSTNIDGPAGWFMISLPTSGVRFQDLAGQNLIQGVSGAQNFYSSDYPEDDFEDNGITSNIFQYTDEDWIAPDNIIDEIPVGTGFIWYLYDNEIGPSKALPFDLTISGEQLDNPVTVDLESNSWNLLGNPFEDELYAEDISVISGDLVSTVLHYWDAGSSSYHLVNMSSSSDVIPEWTGFFIENDNAAEIQMTLDAQQPSSIVTNPSQQITFELEALSKTTDQKVSDRAISLILHEDAEDDWDVFDAKKLTPLGSSFVTLGFVGERENETVIKSQESRNLYSENSFEVPLQLNHKGIYEGIVLNWNIPKNVQANREIHLIDHETGDVINLRKVDSYTFQIVSETEMMDVSQTHSPSPLQLQSDNNPRFTLSVGSVPTNIDSDPSVPTDFSISQNYPNPFNPTTQITISLPREAATELEVFDVLGRSVAVLVNETLSAGKHTVRFDAVSLSSGVYVYQLRAGDFVQSRMMSLVK